MPGDQLPGGRGGGGARGGCACGSAAGAGKCAPLRKLQPAPLTTAWLTLPARPRPAARARRPQALQHVMEGCGEAFRPHLDDSLRALIYRALGHPNRFIR